MPTAYGNTGACCPVLLLLLLSSHTILFPVALMSTNKVVFTSSNWHVLVGELYSNEGKIPRHVSGYAEMKHPDLGYYGVLLLLSTTNQ